MGMSASQARFLMLTARKNNVEFEGQQINQQRTTLSNESAAYYSELCNMVVPTPPSIDDYTKVCYTFDDGAMTNTITTMIAKNDGRYSVNYIQQWQDDYSIVSASSSMIARTAAGEYKVGSTSLRQLGQGGGKINQPDITIDGKTYQVKYDENNTPYIDVEETVSTLVDCTDEEVAQLNYFGGIAGTDLDALRALDMKNAEMNVNPDGTVTFSDGTNNVTMQLLVKQADGTFQVAGSGDAVPDADEANMIICIIDQAAADPNEAVSFVTPKADGTGYEKESTEVITRRKDLTPAQIASISSFDDPYLSTLTSEQVAELLEQEEYYRIMLNEKTSANPNEQWYVRYVKDSTKGNYVPYFYNMNQVNNADYPAGGGFALENINCYTIGSSVKTKEVIDATASVEKDTSGRYIALILYSKDADGNEISTEYSLTTNTTQDEDAYNDAMNKYNYAQFQYDQKVQEINSKIEIVQQQDKALELELKHLDTEESAISTELEAVKKVISKNIESSFKTFNA